MNIKDFHGLVIEFEEEKNEPKKNKEPSQRTRPKYMKKSTKDHTPHGMPADIELKDNPGAITSNTGHRDPISAEK